jgi:2-oxoglutarate dehydrogenase E1 component
MHLSKGTFNEVLDDATVKAKDVKKVLLCSGKIYYDFPKLHKRKK